MRAGRDGARVASWPFAIGLPAVSLRALGRNVIMSSTSRLRASCFMSRCLRWVWCLVGDFSASSERGARSSTGVRRRLSRTTFTAASSLKRRRARQCRRLPCTLPFRFLRCGRRRGWSLCSSAQGESCHCSDRAPLRCPMPTKHILSLTRASSSCRGSAGVALRVAFGDVRVRHIRVRHIRAPSRANPCDACASHRSALLFIELAMLSVCQSQAFTRSTALASVS